MYVLYIDHHITYKKSNNSFPLPHLHIILLSLMLVDRTYLVHRLSDMLWLRAVLQPPMRKKISPLSPPLFHSTVIIIFKYIPGATRKKPKGVEFVCLFVCFFVCAKRRVHDE